MTIASAPTRLLNGGRLVMTAGVQRWIESGHIPYHLTTDDITPEHFRRHHVAVAVTSHLSGSWGDTNAEDSRLNDLVFTHPGGGGRLLSVWGRNCYPKLWIITDDFGGDDSITTVLLPSEY